MRRLVVFAALGLAFAAQAMPLGLRTAMWGVARAGGEGAAAEDDPIPALPADAAASRMRPMWMQAQSNRRPLPGCRLRLERTG